VLEFRRALETLFASRYSHCNGGALPETEVAARPPGE
jgi:hypothetical protein